MIYKLSLTSHTKLVHLCEYKLVHLCVRLLSTARKLSMLYA